MSQIEDSLYYTREDAEARFIRLRTDVAIQIDTLREERGLTQREFAAKLNRSESYVSRLVSGVENLTLKTIAAVEHVLNGTVVKIPWVEQRTNELEFEEMQQLASRSFASVAVAPDRSMTEVRGLMGTTVWNSKEINRPASEKQTTDYGYSIAA